MTAKWTRRQLLGTGASGALVIAGLPVLSSCAAVGRTSARCGEWPLLQRPDLLDETGERVLALASLAPNSHNCQPWRVRLLDAHHIRLAADLKRRLSVVDPQDRELRLSLGAFLENLVLAAGALGREAIVTPRDDWPEVADIAFESRSPSGYPLKRIELRRTLRKGQGKEPIEPTVIRTLLSTAGEATYHPLSSKEGRFLCEATLAAFRQQTQNDKAQSELAEWVHFSDGEAQKKCDGLTPATMELGGIAGWYVRNFMNKDDVTGSSFREEGIDGTAKQLKEGAGFVVIASRSAAAADLVDAGRRFERMVLLLREHGLAGHPMSQAVEEAPWRDTIAREIGAAGTPQFIVRIGRVGAYDKPVSFRRPVAAFVSVS